MWEKQISPRGACTIPTHSMPDSAHARPRSAQVAGPGAKPLEAPASTSPAPGPRACALLAQRLARSLLVSALVAARDACSVSRSLALSPLSWRCSASTSVWFSVEVGPHLE